jgi:hypothetical protein
MKKLSLIFLFIITTVACSLAQNSFHGMKYQAVARDMKGEILANSKIELRISLHSTSSLNIDTHYSEIHSITTSELGLFSIAVGDGTKESGNFESIPWSTLNIWMEISIKSKGETKFTSISNSQLLAVPYAFHAITASKLSDSGAKIDAVNAPTPGVPANVWSLQGNITSNALTDRLGTTDYVDLVVITNNLERLRILANGNITMKRSLAIGANITVDSSAYFNKASGQTINYGPFTVERLSPTLLSGTLTVDRATDLNTSLNVDGPTDLNSRLFVNNASPTKLTGTLRVDGISDFNAAFNVNNASPTVLTGLLTVNKNALFNQQVLLDNAALQSTSTTTGGLVVSGGFGLGGNLNVGGISKFGGPVAFAAAVNITDETESTNITTGALIVSGGMGLAKRLNVGGGVSFSSTLGVTGITNLNNTTQSTANSNGALIVSGGVGILRNLNVGGTFTVSTGADYVATFTNTTNANGISIQVANGTLGPNNSNNYITFRNSSGGVVGRIEGETLDELHNSDDYKFDKRGLVYDVASGALDAGLATFNLADRILFQIEADASVNVCAGVGVVACPPIASFVAGSIAEVALAVVEEALVIAEVAVASVNLVEWTNNKDNSIGVTYQSGSGDYAEYLMKQSASEKINASDIVGVKGGKISKNVEGAEKLMVVSFKPIVLGNTPNDAALPNYEKVAFMGQVPVRVFGKVNLGDYIIPNGANNGVGVAVSPEKIKHSDVKNIVGIAWSVAENPLAISTVNVAIGLNVNDNQKLVENQQAEINELKSEIAKINAKLDRIINGNTPTDVRAVPTEHYVTTGKNTVQVIPDNISIAPSSILQPVKMGPNQIQYYEVTKQDFIKGFDIVQDKMKANGDANRYEKFWSQYNNDPQFKDKIMTRIMTKYNEQLVAQKALDAQLNK